MHTFTEQILDRLASLEPRATPSTAKPPVVVMMDYVTCGCRAVVPLGQLCPNCGRAR